MGLLLTTGQQLWGPTDPEPQMNFYSMDEKIYDGKLLGYGYGGKLVAYDIMTGEVLWEYTAAQVGYESPYGNYPMGISCIADGKIYIHSGEHSPTQPLWRGPVLRCIDADTGEELWKIASYGGDMPMGNAGSRAVIADGCLLHLNHYDNRIYCFGKGPSATTVTAAPAIIAWGDNVLIQGTVTDQSPGTEQLEQAKRFPNGVPAIADEYMDDWMEYVYMQQACPQNVEGVEVVLETLDPNNNFYEIGRVTSDAAGMFKLMWEPPVPGEYTIIATFEGSDSYFMSFAETAMGVVEAPSPAVPMEPEPMPAAPEPAEPEPAAPEPTQLGSTELIPTQAESTGAFALGATELSIIAAVAIALVMGIAAYWTLRKRE